ncbi:MAG TPA: hypothetical protein GXX54_07115 [Clostridiales bacterium]|nr:hypothetical protein [Clostridiales bacterium]
MFETVTLEMSLKPFKKTDDESIKKVCEKLFSQWLNLIKGAEVVKVMLWSSDGSEILSYKGNLDDEFEWAKYLGGANIREKWNKKADPERIGLHSTHYLYMDNPPVFTYRKLAQIIRTLKEVGNAVTGKKVMVGATFDPGPEFAKSDFKYRRHPEICHGNAMGEKSFVCCYGVLHGDNYRYAGFPEGIPEGTKFGTFFGRQCRHFLTDLGFDYIWFSNGLGFGSETWGVTGEIFDGERFYPEKISKTREQILEFWRLFRQECPDFPVETRGTNLSAAIDLATDGVPLYEIYKNDFGILPPPNSPWAAMDGDFGLEIAGYMSRISKLPPDGKYLFRFYAHDPWWMNSPWLDRYEGQPHDIYLPLSIARIDGEGKINKPGQINFLTVDNSLGDMPDKVPNEIIPHILKAAQHAPDDVSPLVWVYPMDEYNNRAGKSEQSIKEIFFGDWFIRGAINNGLPLSSVISTDNFVSVLDKNPGFFDGSVIVTIPPVEGTEIYGPLMEFINRGGRVILYGTVSDVNLRSLLGLKTAEELTGEFSVKLNLPSDLLQNGNSATTLAHRSLTSMGGLGDVPAENAANKVSVLAVARQGDNERVIAVHRKGRQGGGLVWIRGTCSCSYKKGQYLLQADSPEKYFIGESLMRYALSVFGYNIIFDKPFADSKGPVIMLSRNNNAFYFSGYHPDTTVGVKMRFPLGAPLLMGSEALIKDGYANYFMPRAWHHECRVFIEQEGGTVSCREYPPVSAFKRRRISVTGLKNAVLRILPEKGQEETMEVLLNSEYPFVLSEEYSGRWIDTPYGRCYEAENLTGTALISFSF